MDYFVTVAYQVLVCWAAPHRAALAQDASAEADTTGSACWDEVLDLTFQ
jgi:hypothetical protein